MNFYLGNCIDRKIFWNPNKEQNPHMVICGSSGSGKTYTIKRLIKTLSKKEVSFTILDKHGDIYEEKTDSLKHIVFTKKTRMGLNPLKPLQGNTLSDTARAFADVLTSLNSRMRIGDIQENMLYSAIMELYYKNNIQEDNSLLAYFPDLTDLVNLLWYKYKKILIGESDYREMDFLYKLFREKTKLLKLEKKAGKNEIEDIDTKINNQIDVLVKLYRNYLEKGIINDRDFITYSDPKSLLSLINKLMNINRSDVFVKNEIDYNNSIVNIKALEDTQKKVFAYYLILRLYSSYMNSELSDGVKHYLIIDEAQFYLDVPQISSLLIKICQEGRKFGLGLILATQNPLLFDIDIILNASTKIIMAIDPIIQPELIKRYAVDRQLLNMVIPRKSFLFSSKANNNGKYILIETE